jgi:hypothetical protein
MHDMCDTREMCEARKPRSSRACRASSRDPCMRDVWGMPRPVDLRACEASDPVGHYSIAPGVLYTTGTFVHHRGFCTLPGLLYTTGTSVHYRISYTTVTLLFT